MAEPDSDGTVVRFMLVVEEIIRGAGLQARLLQRRIVIQVA
ncbi:MAG TPA: hypothetical protein VN837_03630 [Chloroflexota bacterium]|nr:hypothetical protein [Chloroflexota bacterium]